MGGEEGVHRGKLKRLKGDTQDTGSKPGRITLVVHLPLGHTSWRHQDCRAVARPAGCAHREGSGTDRWAECEDPAASGLCSQGIFSPQEQKLLPRSPPGASRSFLKPPSHSTLLPSLLGLLLAPGNTGLRVVLPGRRLGAAGARGGATESSEFLNLNEVRSEEAL